jgi:hypothetical protein
MADHDGRDRGHAPHVQLAHYCVKKYLCLTYKIVIRLIIYAIAITYQQYIF